MNHPHATWQNMVPEQPSHVSRSAPGPASTEIEAVFEALNVDATAEYTRLFQTYGDVVRLDLGPFVTHLLFHPDHAKHVYVTAVEKYDKETYGNKRLRALTGARGLLFAEGAMWQRQRRLTQATLAKSEHERFAKLTREAMLAHCQTWPNHAASTGAVDVQELTARAMFSVVIRGLLSRQVSDDEIGKLRWALTTMGQRRSRVPKPQAGGADSGNGDDDFTRAHAFMDAAILANIQQRKRETPVEDFLGQLLTDGVLEGTPFTEHELLDQAKTMLVAGHDSVAHSIVFALYFLSIHPTWQARVREEGKLLAGDAALSETAASMKQTEAVAMETLRLLPAIWSNERRAVVEDEIDGWRIPRGSTVVLSPYIVHRHPQFWEQPNEFLPDRFLQANPLRHRYSYFPFGGGQRTCIGNHLAMVQLKVALGTLLNQYRIELAPEFKYEFNHMVVLRFMNGLPLRLIPL